MEEEISSVVQLFINFLSNDNDIRYQIDDKIQELITNDPNSFSQLMISILQDYQDYPLEISFLCLIFLRKIFYKSTIALKTNNERLSYSIIPQEVADSYIPLVSSFFSNENTQLSQYASHLLGQLAIYLLNYDLSHPIFLSLIDQIDEGQLITPSLESIHFILLDDYQLIESSEVFQQEFMNKIISWLDDENFPFESKPLLIKIITTLVPLLSHILLTVEDNNTFIQMMLTLTEIPEFKIDSYEFWTNLSTEVPELLCYTDSSLCEISIQDLDEKLSNFPNFEEDDEVLIYQILQFWVSFVDAEGYEPTLKNVEEILPSFLPFLLLNAEKVIDLSTFDEEYSIFTSICNVITQITYLYYDSSIPILTNYGIHAIESEEINEKVTGFYAINLLISCYSDIEDEEFFSFCTQCVEISLNFIETEFDLENQVDMLRIVAQAIENIYNIEYFYPEMIEYSKLLPRLVELMKSPACKNSEILIINIIKNEKLEPSSLFEIISALLDVQTYDAIDCVWEILNNISPNELLDQIYTQIFEYISQIIESNTADELISILLTPLLKITGLIIDKDFNIISNDFENFVQTIIKCYEKYENPNSIRILSICGIIAGNEELIQYIIDQIIYQLDNADDCDMIFYCLDSLILNIKSIDLSNCFGELMRSLLTHQESTKDLTIKIMILEAINSLHESFSPLIQPYVIARLIPLYGSAAACFEKVENEKEKLLEQLLRASLLFLQDFYQTNDSNQENEEIEYCLQISYRSIKCFFYSDNHDDQLVLLLFDLLNYLIQVNPIFAKDILSEDCVAKYIQSQAENLDDETTFPSLTAIVQFMSHD